MAYYECRDCTARFTGVSPSPDCPNCGGELQNIEVPRE